MGNMPATLGLAILLLAAWPSLGIAQTQGESAPVIEEAVPANIDRNGVIILIRSALLALDQANKTGNYTVLRDLGAPGFQVNSAARLGEIFQQQRAERLDLAGVAVLEPQLTLLPQIEPGGYLHMAGFFPSVPTQVNFELMFAPHERQWKLFGISTNLTPGGPIAPETPDSPSEDEDPEPPVAPGPEIVTQPEN